MLEHGLYYKRCHRHNAPGDAHELTFSCFHNQKFLRSDRICQWLVGSINRAREKHRFSLWAYVFMPSHVHLLICPQTETYSISKILQAIKQPVAQKAIAWLKKNNPQGLRRLATGQQHRTYRLWQDGGGYDRNITGERAVVNVIHYIHANPSRRGLVENAEQWQYSSAAAWQSGNSPLAIDVGDYPLP